MKKDFTLLSGTIYSVYRGKPTFLSYVTKDFASLLNDQQLIYDSLLRPGFNIHGRETQFIPNEIVDKTTGLNGSLALVAKALRIYEIVPNGQRKHFRPLLSSFHLPDLVADETFFIEEARVLSNLKLREKILLAGHRDRSMTLESYFTVDKIFHRYCHLFRDALLKKQRDKLCSCVDKMNECAKELRQKVLYPKESERLKVKLDQLPSVAAAMLVSTIEEDQGDFNSQIYEAERKITGSHYIRSFLREKGLYDKPSKSVEIEDHILRNRFSFQCPKKELQELEDLTPILDFLEDGLVAQDMKVPKEMTRFG